jgi:peptidoglycan/LPS O-acetylase OafA/YrhL
MPPAHPPRSRLEARFARSRIAAFRDVVAKRPSTGENLAALDGLRGLAVLLVVAAHADGLHQQGHGATGVWLFFTLSAFLLTLPLGAEPARASDPTALRRYAIRRVLRVLPAYWLAVAVVAALDGEGAAFLARHVVFLQATGIFWTIPQEMLFYALLPPLALLHPRVLRGNAVATIAVLLALAAASHRWLTVDVVALHGNDKRLPFHVGIFATGMAAAYAPRIPGFADWARRPRVRRALDATGVVLLAALPLSAPWFVAQLDLALPGAADLLGRVALERRGAVGLACAALVLTAYACTRGWTHRILCSPPLRVLGVVSFSLYLFHVVVQNALLRALPDLGHGTLLFACTLVASFAVACLGYSWVERPCMQWGRRIADRIRDRRTRGPRGPASPPA